MKEDSQFSFSLTSQFWIIFKAILDGACISLPNGSLVECYDELGARYAIPVYCLSYPINIVFGRDNGSPETSTDGRDTPAEESEPVESGKKGDNSKSRTNKDKKKKEREEGKDMKIKVRISLTSSSDTRLLVNTAETVLSAKKRLYAQVSFIYSQRFNASTNEKMY